MRQQELAQLVEAQDRRLESVVQQLRAHITAGRLQLLAFAVACQWRSHVLRQRERRRQAELLHRYRLGSAALSVVRVVCNKRLLLRMAYESWRDARVATAFDTWRALFQGRRKAPTQRVTATRAVSTLDDAGALHDRRLLVDAWVAWVAQLAVVRPRLARARRRAEERAIAGDAAATEAERAELAQRAGASAFTSAVSGISAAESAAAERAGAHLARAALSAWREALWALRPHWQRDAAHAATNQANPEGCDDASARFSRGFGSVWARSAIASAPTGRLTDAGDALGTRVLPVDSQRPTDARREALAQVIARRVLMYRALRAMRLEALARRTAPQRQRIRE